MVGAHKFLSTSLYFNKSKLKSKICNSTHANTIYYWLSEKWSSSDWVWTVPEQSPEPGEDQLRSSKQDSLTDWQAVKN